MTVFATIIVLTVSAVVLFGFGVIVGLMLGGVFAGKAEEPY